jgi:ribosomal protein S9
MPSDLTAASAITKIGYGDIHEQLDPYITALQLVDRGSKHINEANQEVQFGAHMQRSQGVGARAESEQLPTAGANKDARASMFLKYQYGRIQGTGQVFKQVTGNTTSFVDWMQREVTTITDTLKRDLNREVYGDGTGTMATLTANAITATVITVDDPHFVEIGMYVDVLTAATLGNNPPTKGNTAPMLVTAVDPVGLTITLSGGTVTALLNSVVVRTDSASGVNNWKKEWEGLGLITNASSTYANLAPGTWPLWVPGYVATSVATLSELTLTHLAQGIHQRGGKVTDFLTSYGVVNAYWNTLQGKRQFTGDQATGKMVGGMQQPAFQSIFGEVPITADWAAPKGTLWSLNKDEMYVHQLADWNWMDKTGTMWQQVPNTDAYSATIFQYSNIGVFRRNSFGKLSGITEL